MAGHVRKKSYIFSNSVWEPYGQRLHIKLSNGNIQNKAIPTDHNFSASEA
jgi:hypothetical protein